MEKNGNGVFRKIISLWWVLLGPTLIFSGAGMYIAGRKVKHKKWKIYGIIYNVLIVGSMVLADVTANDNLYGVGGLLWIVFMIHSIKIIKEYLIRREMLSEANNKFNKEDNLRDRIRREYNLDDNIDKTINEYKPKIQDDYKVYGDTLVRENAEHIRTEDCIQPFKDEEPTNEFLRGSLSECENLKEADTKLDVNHALEEEIAELPAIGAIRAKKIVEVRNTQGVFKDLNDFIIKTELKPHIVDKIRDKIYFKAPEQESTSKNHSNRARRMVDI